MVSQDPMPEELMVINEINLLKSNAGNPFDDSNTLVSNIIRRQIKKWLMPYTNKIATQKNAIAKLEIQSFDLKGDFQRMINDKEIPDRFIRADEKYIIYQCNAVKYYRRYFIFKVKHWDIRESLVSFLEQKGFANNYKTATMFLKEIQGKVTCSEDEFDDFLTKWGKQVWDDVRDGWEAQ